MYRTEEGEEQELGQLNGNLKEELVRQIRMERYKAPQITRPPHPH